MPPKVRDPHVVLVSMQRPLFAYADIARKLLKEGQPEIVLAGLGTAINNVVTISSILEAEGLVTVTNIETSRGDTTADMKRLKAPRLRVTVIKTHQFDEIFERMSQRRVDFRRAKAIEAQAQF